MSQPDNGVAALPRHKLDAVIRRIAGKKIAVTGGIARRADRGDRCAASFAQERLWFLDRLQPGSLSYHLPGGLRLEGALDLPALEQALAALEHRHESLRTRLDAAGDALEQVIGPAVARPLPVVDLAALLAGVGAEQARRLAHAEGRRPFDLGRGPLWRTVLLRLGPQRHLLLITLHHAVADGWSLDVIGRELPELYAAFALRRPSALAELPIQYADFALWQRELLTGETLERQLVHWRARLAGLPELELPADRPRPVAGGLRAATLTLRLGGGLSAAIADLARERAATPFMVFLAVFSGLLHRLTGQPDLAVGSPIAGRTRRELEGLIGLFVNTLVLRSSLAGDPRLSDHLETTRRLVLEAYEHQDVPFDRLVDELGARRGSGRNPLFQVAFALQETVRGPLSVPGATWTPVELPRAEAKLELGLSIERCAGGDWELVWTWAREVFDRTRIERLARGYRALLAAVARDPEQRLGELPVLAAAERQQLLVEWNAAEPAYPVRAQLGLHALVLARAAERPEAVAVVREGEVVSYGELVRRAGVLAGKLRALGVGPERLVAVCAERSPEMVVGMLGVLAAGAAYLPIDPEYPPERVERLLAAASRHAGPPVVLTQRALAERCHGVGGAAVPPDPANPAYVLFTSGSTGEPKGVVISHRAVVNRLEWVAAFEPPESFLHKTSIGFDLSVVEIFGTLAAGGRLVLARSGGQHDPGYLLGRIRDERVSDASFLPAHFQMLLERGGLEHCRSLVRMMTGGEAVPPDLPGRLYAQLLVELHNRYGPTETTISVTSWRFPRGIAEASSPIGRPIAAARVYLVDAALRPVMLGSVGEIVVGGVCVGRGYLGRPGETAASFVPDVLGEGAGERLYRTGDLGRFRADGALEFFGRRDGQVKVRGFRIELGEIEAVVRRHPGVETAAVLVREVRGERALAAYVVGAVAPEELRAFVARALPEYMVPAHVTLLDRLPLGATGKIDRAALERLELAAEPAAGRAPRGELEELVARHFAAVLGLEQVDAEASFFELGGNSVRGAMLINRLQEELGAAIPVVAIFDAPSVAALARSLGAHDVAEALLPRPAGAGPWPLSFHQERLWFLDQWQPANPAYNMPAALDLAGRLRPAALEAALGTIVRRHEALRTMFRATDAGPVQEVGPAGAVALPIVDLEALGVGAGREAERRSRALARRPFDLAVGPLLRAAVLRLGPERHRLVAVMHHVVSDGWSMAIFVRELRELYTAAVEARAADLPALPVQSADFALWQRRTLAGAKLETQLAFWRDRLAGAPALLELPLDRPRPRLETFAGATLAQRLPRMPALGATPFTVLLALFGVLLARHTGQDDVVVGSPTAGRTRPEIEGLIGFFVNTLALRLDLGGGPSFAELVERVRRTARAAFEHQEVPFEKIVDDVRPERDPSHAPIFQVLFVYQNVPFEPLVLPELEVRPVALDTATAKLDLTLTLAEDAAGLRALWEHNTALFDRTTIARLARCFERLLEAAIADPQRPVAELPLLGVAERHQVTVEPNATAASFDAAPIHGLVARQAARTPEAVAVVFEDTALSYDELMRTASRAARQLRARGVVAGDFVGVSMERSLELVAALLGVLEAGAAYVPLEPSLPALRLAAMLAELGGGREPVVLRRLESREEESAPLGVAVDLDPAAYAIYTSGSTGRPKGVVNSHRGVVNRLLWGQACFGLGGEDAVLQKTPFSFDVSVWELFWPLLAGARLEMARPGGHQDPAYLAAKLRDARITHTHFVPSMLLIFLEEIGEQRFPALRRVLASGEALSPELASRFVVSLAGVELHNLYGPTEAAIEVSWWRCPATPPERVTIGRPTANVALHVLDRAFRPVPLAVAGELHIGGVQVARGYLGQPALSAERFVPDPFGVPGGRLYKTGDRTRWLVSGEVEYLGRLDHQVKIRGLRIELGEIEAVLREHTAVREAAVAVHGERLVGYVVARGEVDVEALRAHLGRRLPAYMVPALIEVLAALPTTASGKLDRKALPALSAGAIEAGFTAARTEVEALIAGIWAEVLDRERVGVHDDFFALGGHSLLATRVVSRLRGELGVEVPLREVFEVPTVAGLAERVEALRRTAAGLDDLSLLPWTGEGEPPLSFAQERLWFLDQLAPGSAEYNVAGAVRLVGELAAGALAASLGELARRQASLRTSFPEVGGRPVQRIAPPAAGPWPLARVDLGGVCESELRRVLRAEAARGFDLAQGPLARFLLLRVKAVEHVLFLNLHHAISDGWSLGVLVRELGAVYAAVCAGRPSPLAPLAVHYTDYARWQRRWLETGVLERQLGYWRQRLAGAPAALELPADRPRPKVRGGRGGVVRRRLGSTATLTALGREHGATLFMVLLAGFAALVLRLTHREDVVVGTPIAGRTRRELEDLVGFFVNTLVLRTDLGGDPSFGELVGRVRETALGAFLHQDVPFEKLVEELRPERDTSRTPLVQVIFGLQNAPLELALPGLKLETLGVETGSSKFDLNVSLVERAGELVGGFEYDADLFDRTTIERLARQYGVLLGGLSPEMRLASLEMLSAAERAMVEREWQPAAAPSGPRPAAPVRRLEALFLAQVEARPEAVALVWGEQQLSYGELARRAWALAGELRGRGVGVGTLVGLRLERSAEQVVAILGVLLAGGAYVPIDPAYPEERAGFIARDAGFGVLLEGVDLWTPWTPWTSWTEEKRAGGELCYVIYTSGSTGQPKGSLVCHEHVFRLFEACSRRFSFGADDCWSLFHSFAFDFSVWEIWGALAFGGRLVGVPYLVSRSPEEFADLLLRERVSVLSQTPSAFLQLAPVLRSRGALREVVFGGEALEPARLSDWFSRFGDSRPRLVNMYGITETTVHVTFRVLRSSDASRGASPVGRPLDHLRCWLLDRRGTPVAVGVVGELFVGGAGLSRGYLGRPGLSAERFVPDRFSGERGARLYKSGDLARWDARGELLFLGRIDHQVKIRGFRIELGEIEAALVAHPGVRAAAVLPWGTGAETRLVAWCVREADDAELRRHLAARLPEHMVPAVFVDVAALPLTAHGKLDRRALPEPGLRAVSAGYGAPRTALEEVLAGAWAEALGVERVGVDESFFELGGHSILATQMMAWVRETFAVEVPLARLFERPTVAALAEALERDGAQSARVRRTAELLLEMAVVTEDALAGDLG